MERQRRVVGPETAECVVCGGARAGVRYESWLPAGRFTRRRDDVRSRWQCGTCGSRVDVAAAPVGRHVRSRTTP